MNIMSFRKRLKYEWLRIELYILFNFGRGYFECIQFFDLRFVPKKNTKGEAAVTKHFHSYYCWTVGAYFIVFDGRYPCDR